MQITVSPLVKAIIDNEIESGRFQTIDEVVLAALRLLQETTAPPVPDEWPVEARAQVDRGEGRELTEELWNEIRDQARENARLGKPVPDEVKY